MIRYNIINWITNLAFDLWCYLDKIQIKYYSKYYAKSKQVKNGKIN